MFKDKDDNLNINYQINKKIDSLLKTNIEFKYKKSPGRSNDQMVKELINLEVSNSQLEKNVSNYKYQLEVLKQKNIDLKIELNEMKYRVRKSEEERRNFIKVEDAKTCGGGGKSQELDNSLDDYEAIMENNTSLLDSIKKNKVDSSKLYNDISGLLKELKLTKDKLKEKEDIIVEKDNIINILYQEIDNMKSSGRSKEGPPGVDTAEGVADANSLMYHSPEFHRNRRNDHFSFNKLAVGAGGNTTEETEAFKKTHLDNLDLIKLSLIEFLEKYNIKDNISFEENAKDVDAIIEARMKEIKYIIVNMKKINILFKTMFKEFSKDVYQTVDIILNNQINNKLEVVSKRLTRLAIEVDRKVV
jgi:hypothetical protein